MVMIVHGISRMRQPKQRIRSLEVTSTAGSRSGLLTARLPSKNDHDGDGQCGRKLDRRRRGGGERGPPHRVEPATGDAFAELTLAMAADVDDAVAAARRA